MTQIGTEQNSRLSSARIWWRRIFTSLAVIWTAVVFFIIAGALLPRIPQLGAIGTLFEAAFSLHLVIAGAIGVILALLARRFGAGRLAVATALAAIVATLGAIFPLIAIVRAAHDYGAEISWTDHLHATARTAAAGPNRVVLYATEGGKNLYADVYLPANPPAGKSAPVLMMHGGGYVGGERSMMLHRHWDRWLTDRGYTVFDIDYRLAPPPTWNLAAQDAACAMAWIGSHADAYDVDPDRMLVAGLSAGAGLALQVAYGLGDGTVQSSCGGTVPQPKAVFALYPPDDCALGWNMKTKLGPASARTLLNAYIGGSPQEYPERYRAVSAIFHVRPGLPPTLIASGENDHLVPFEGHVELVGKLNRAGVPNALVAIPYSDHAYDALWLTLGAQITRHALGQFLNQYLPATETR